MFGLNLRLRLSLPCPLECTQKVLFFVAGLVVRLSYSLRTSLPLLRFDS
uniref:Uncharacterized protein n=1 Tax=Utricularia reniformis TaxID=192314 RepID=A0A1Y0AZE5_9LAMI|nr:hypothetical protein AEK19_MT0224 [Utricularia reniformis]ART30501.1 hypothetical protein AEK19_MT0224 [Utricularia reniformis]